MTRVTQRDSDYLPVKEVARAIGMTPQFVYGEIRAGAFDDVIRPSLRGIRVHRDSLAKYKARKAYTFASSV